MQNRCVSAPRFLAALWVIAGLLGTPLSAFAAILENGGFETGNFAGWTVNNVNGALSGVQTDNTPIPGVAFYKQNVRSGDYAAYATVAASPNDPFPGNPLPPRYLSLSQQVDLLAGTYEASFYLGNYNISGESFGTLGAIAKDILAIVVDGVALDFFDPTQVIASESSPADFFRYDADFTATAGLHTIEFRISGSAVNIVGISIDDFAVVQTGGSRGPPRTPTVDRNRDLSDLPIPEPASMLMAVSGILGLAWSRRRRPTG